PRRGSVTAVAHQVLAASRETRMQIETAGAARRANPWLHTHRIERDQHYGAMELFSQPRRDNADHARMPAALSQHERGVSVGIELLGGLPVGGQINAALKTLTAAVQLVQIRSQRACTLGRVGRQKFNAER